MKKFNCLLSFLFVLTLSNQSYASHAMGGEISYVCLGNNQYEVTVDFYRDCSGINAPATMSVNFQNSCGLQMSTVYLSQIPGSPQLVTYVCPNEVTTCDGGSFLGIEKYTYRGVITFPGECHDWTISHSENARNAAITTIVGAGAIDLHFYATINNTSGICNNSPVIVAGQYSRFCVGQFNCLTGTAYDVDGDSLYYELVQPLESSTTEVTYLPGYTYLQPLNSNPPATFSNSTGLFCFTAQQADVTILAIKVSEFRNGVFVGSIVRDVQLNIEACSNFNPIVTGLDYFSIDSAVVCAGVQTCFSVASVDPDATNSTSMFFTYGYQGITITQTHGYRDSAIICLAPLPEDTAISPVRLTVRVEDDNCPYFGMSLKEFTFSIINDAGCLTSVSDSDLNSFHAYLKGGRLLRVDLESQPENAGLIVFDLAGKAVFRSHVDDRSNTFDLGKLSPGLYIVGITDGVRKFSPQKLLLY